MGGVPSGAGGVGGQNGTVKPVHGLSLVGGERGLLFIAVRRLLIAVASLVAEHRL